MIYMENKKIYTLLERKGLPRKGDNKEKINRKLPDICKRLRVEDALVFLKSKDVLNETDAAVIRTKLAAEGNWIAALELMFRLSRKEIHWYGKFFETLQETNQSHLAEEIDKVMHEKIQQCETETSYMNDDASCSSNESPRRTGSDVRRAKMPMPAFRCERIKKMEEYSMVNSGKANTKTKTNTMYANRQNSISEVKECQNERHLSATKIHNANNIEEIISVEHIMNSKRKIIHRKVFKRAAFWRKFKTKRNRYTMSHSPRRDQSKFHQNTQSIRQPSLFNDNNVQLLSVKLETTLVSTPKSFPSKESTKNPTPEIDTSPERKLDILAHPSHFHDNTLVSTPQPDLSQRFKSESKRQTSLSHETELESTQQPGQFRDITPVPTLDLGPFSENALTSTPELSLSNEALFAYAQREGLSYKNKLVSSEPGPSYQNTQGLSNESTLTSEQLADQSHETVLVSTQNSFTFYGSNSNRPSLLPAKHSIHNLKKAREQQFFSSFDKFESELAATIKTRIEPGPSFQEALEQWRRKTTNDAINEEIIIDKTNVMDSLCKVTKRQSFCWQKPVYVIFLGDHGNDLNDEKKNEFFRILMKEVKNLIAENGSLELNLMNVENNVYFLCGRYIVWSLLHGGHSCRFLSTKILDLMLGNDVELSVDDVNKTDEKQLMQQLLGAETNDQIPSAWLIDIGIPPPFFVKRKQLLVKLALKQLMYYRIHAELHQFKKGLNSFGFLDALRDYKEGLQSLLCLKREILTPEKSRDDAQYNFSTDDFEQIRDTVPKRRRPVVGLPMLECIPALFWKKF